MNTLQVRVKPNNIGRFACIEVAGPDGRPLRVYGNVLDLVAGTDLPKRIRIQRGYPELHGQVVQPGQYHFCWFSDEEED
jgi:hypothetical protein